MSELKIKMQNVESIATLVIQQQKDFENHINAAESSVKPFNGWMISDSSHDF